MGSGNIPEYLQTFAVELKYFVGIGLQTGHFERPHESRIWGLKSVASLDQKRVGHRKYCGDI